MVMMGVVDVVVVSWVGVSGKSDHVRNTRKPM